jgi:hypothetical protein
VISLSLPPAATCPIATRASAANAVTTCSGERAAAASKERPSVLPSIATTPAPSTPSPSRNTAKPPANATGSSSRNSRE